MNLLQDLIRNINPARMGRHGRNTMSSILARAEQVIFDQLLVDRDISDIEGARNMLKSLHADDAPGRSQSFDDYLDTLESMGTENEFAVELTELMREVNDSQNPSGVLEELISRERGSGLQTQQDILPDDFWSREGRDPASIAGEARFSAEFLEDPNPGLMERARYTLFGERSEPPTVPTGVEPPTPFESPVASAESTAGWDLRLWDYDRINEYFSSQRLYSELSIDQQQMVESLRYTPDEFDSKFDSTYDASRYHELREQLRAELLDDHVLSQGEMNSFVGIEESFGVSAEEFGMHFAAGQGGEIVMPDVSGINIFKTQTVKDAAKDLAIKAIEELGEKRDIAQNTFAQIGRDGPLTQSVREARQEQITQDTIAKREALIFPEGVPDSVEVMREKILARTTVPDIDEGFDYSSEQQLRDFDEIADNPEDVYGAGPEPEPFDEPEISLTQVAKGFVEKQATNILGADTVARAKGFSARAGDVGYMNALKEEAIAALGGDETTGLLSAVKGKAFSLAQDQAEMLFAGFKEGVGSVATRASLAIGSAGEILLSRSFLKSFLRHQASNVVNAPLILPLINFIANGNEAVGNYINLGLGIYDLAMTGTLGVFGLGMAVFGVAMQQFEKQVQAAHSNDDPTQYRGERFGYIKVGTEWRPAIVKELRKSEALLSLGRTVQLEYGDDLIWKMAGDGSILPYFTNPQMKQIETDAWTYETVATYTRQNIEDVDSTRDWYFVDPDERERLIMATRTGELEGWESYNIKDGLNAYERSLEDARQVLERMTRFKTKQIEGVTGASAGFYDDFPTDRELRRSGQNDSRYAWSNNQHVHHPPDSTWNTLTDRELDAYFSMSEEQTNRYKFNNFREFPENEFYLKTAWFNSFKTLVKTQRLAAENAGYDKYFPKGYNEANYPDSQTPWSAQYTLPDHEYEMALNAEMLNEQMDNIETLDLTQVDKDFLSNKVINRFWVGLITRRGGGDALMDMLQDKEPAFIGGLSSPDYDKPRIYLNTNFYVAPMFSIVSGGHTDYERLDRVGYMNRYTHGWESEMGQRMPWVNSNDNGIFPSEALFQDLNAENLALNTEYYQSQNELQKRFEMSKAAVDDFAKYSRRGSNLWESKGKLDWSQFEGFEMQKASLFEQPDGSMSTQRPVISWVDSHPPAPPVDTRPPTPTPSTDTLWNIEDESTKSLLITNRDSETNRVTGASWKRVLRFEPSTFGDSIVYFEDGTQMIVESFTKFAWRDKLPEVPLRPITSTIPETQQLFDDLAESNPEIFAWISNNQDKNYPGYTYDKQQKAFQYMFNYIKTKKVTPLPEAGGVQPDQQDEIVADSVEPPPQGWTLTADRLRYKSPDGQEFLTTDVVGVSNYARLLTDPTFGETFTKFTATKPPDGWIINAYGKYEAPDGTSFGHDEQEEIRRYAEQLQLNPMAVEPVFTEKIDPPRPMDDVRAEAARMIELDPPSMEDAFHDHVVEEFNKRTELHHDEDGKLIAISLDGERFHINELLGETPDDVAGIQEELTTVFGKGEEEEEDPFEELEEYLHETGVQNVTREMMTEYYLPSIAWDEHGTPLLHGDEALERKLGLPDDIEAVMTSNGVVVKMFHPGMHGISNDGFRHD